MAGIKSFLSRKDKADLIRFVAMVGESYPRYLEWAEKRSAKPYTAAYFRTWCQRRRTIIQEERMRQKEETRKLSQYDRSKRLDELERVASYLLEQMDFIRSHEICEKNCKPIETLLKLMEQHRRTMEAISKERGEWNKPDQQPNPSETRALIARREALDALHSGRKIIVIEPKTEDDDMGNNEEYVG